MLEADIKKLIKTYKTLAQYGIETERSVYMKVASDLQNLLNK